MKRFATFQRKGEGFCLVSVEYLLVELKYPHLN
jgi:hypothetical protein